MAIANFDAAEKAKKERERLRPAAHRAARDLLYKFYHLRKRPLISFWRDISYAKKCAALAVEMVIEEQKASKSFADEHWELVLEEINKAPWFDLNKW